MNASRLGYALGLAAWALAAGSAAADDKAKDKTAMELKPHFVKAGWVLVGKYTKDREYNKQTLYTFEDCTHFKAKREFGTKIGAATDFGAYGSAKALEKAEKGKRYVVFGSVDYGEVFASFPETAERLAVLKDWAQNGVYSKAERDQLRDKAGWVVVVDRPDERCAESIPCQHFFAFTVVKVLKGDKVPDKFTLRGSYRKHVEMPDGLKVTSASGKVILFMDADGKADSSVLGAVPWSAEMEKELAKK
jgi:hypothetical protein